MGKGNLRIVMSFLLCYESTVGKEILMVKIRILKIVFNIYRQVYYVK